MKFVIQTTTIDRIHRWIDYLGHMDFTDDTVGLAHLVALGSVPEGNQRPDVTAFACLFIATTLHGSPIMTENDPRMIKLKKKHSAQFWSRYKKYDVLHDPDNINFFRLKEKTGKMWKFEESQ